MAPTPTLTLDRLREEIESGDIDTVVVAFTDMQGRLQGKRLHGHYFLDHVLEDGTEGCNYLLAVDVDMNTVDGYAISSWERGYGDMFFDLDLDDAAPHSRRPHSATVQCDLTWLDGSGARRAVAALGAQGPGRPGRGARSDGLCGTELEFIVFEDSFDAGVGPGLHRADPGQPLQRRLLDPRR